jgi:hypothetical protein
MHKVHRTRWENHTIRALLSVVVIGFRIRFLLVSIWVSAARISKARVSVGLERVPRTKEPLRRNLEVPCMMQPSHAFPRASTRPAQHSLTPPSHHLPVHTPLSFLSYLHIRLHFSSSTTASPLSREATVANLRLRPIVARPTHSPPPTIAREHEFQC